MGKLIIACLFLAFAGTSVLADEIGCFEKGECKFGFSFGLLQGNDRDPLVCLEFCQNTLGCTYFTMRGNDCLAYSICDYLEDCSGCQSGPVTCPSDGLTCASNGVCLGELIAAEEDAETLTDCERACSQRPDCNWWTLYQFEKLCLMYKDCPSVSDDCLDCYHGQRECGFNGGPCGGHLDANFAGDFTSPGYPRNYDPEVSCNWELTTDLDQQVRLHIMDAQFKGVCSENSGARLDIFDVIDGIEVLVDQICSSGDVGKTIISTENKLVARLHGDEGGEQFRGFRAQYVYNYPTAAPEISE